MKPKIKIKLVFFLVLSWSIIFIFALVSAKSPSDIKEGKLFINEPTQNGSFFISALMGPLGANISQNETISPVLRADFPFNALFIKWDYKNEPKPEILTDELTDSSTSDNINFELYVRFLNEDWSNWLKMLPDEDSNGKDNSTDEFISQMIPTKLTDSFQYKLVFNSKETKDNLKNLEFTYLDTTKGPSENFKISSQADSGLKIISRQEWGANEAVRFDENNNELWPEEYYTPKKIVIHHTAGENANLDPMATVRAIEYWHAKNRGWGDIGYNYLIDSKGNIYEGRYGGDGVVGGHAYLRNRNTIGISILGCYENQPSIRKGSTCNTPDQLTEATKTALNRLIAEKSKEFNIDPLGSSEFHGQILPNVIAHRDIGSTNCPGNLVYETLPQVRQLAYNSLQSLGGFEKPLPAAAEFVRQSAKEINIEESKTADLIVEFKNTGQAVWRGYEDNYLFVSDSEIKNKLAQIDSFKIALVSDDKTEDPATQSNSQAPIFKLLGGNVYPNEIGKFKLTLAAPTTKTETKNFVLAWQDKGYFPGSDFAVTTNRIACTSCNLNNPQPIYQAALLNSTFPVQMNAESLQSVNLQFKNTGSQSWDKDKLKLKILYNQNQASPFKDKGWFDDFASISPNEDLIQPAGLATFDFKLKAPAKLAVFPHTLTLFYNNQTLYGSDQSIEVIYPFSAQISANTLPDTTKRNKRVKVTLTFKNTGSKTWTNPILKSYDIDGTNSWFKDWSWYDNKTVKKIKKSVKPGEQVEFTFRLLPYWKAAKYPQVFKLYNGKNQIYLDGQKALITYTQVTK